MRRTSHDEQDGGDSEGGAREDDVDVHHHSDGEQEVGDEQCVSDKLDGCHERRGDGDVAVEDESGEEGAEDGLEAHHLRAPCGHEHHGEDVDELGDLVVVFLEEPACYARIEVDDGDAVCGREEDESQQREGVEVGGDGCV